MRLAVRVVSLIFASLLILIYSFAIATAQNQPTEPDDRFSFAGRITDDKDLPIAGVEVTATHRYAGGYGYIDVVKTDGDGKFSINRSVAISGAKPMAIGEGETIRLDFSHPDHLPIYLEDLRALSSEGLSQLRVVLRSGRSLRGRVVDSGGAPTVGAMVQAVFGDQFELRKATSSDAQGGFELRGLPLRDAVVEIIVTDSKSPALSGRVEVRAKDFEKQIIVTVKSIDLPKVIHELFGMKLLDVDEQLRDAFHLHHEKGVVILDPGAKVDRLGIGRLQRGDMFWIVGDVEVKNFADLKDRLLAVAQPSDQDKGLYRCRVVYTFARVDSAGTNTQYIQLTAGDLQRLREETKPKR